MTAVIIGALSVMTSATDYTVTRYLGVKYSLPRVTAANDYDSASNSYRFSDPSMVLINGKPSQNALSYTPTIPWSI